jgi:NTP pyrophosphatase (non-canonical NTP hydrolase)
LVKENSLEREQLTRAEFKKAAMDVSAKLEKRLKEKGYGSASSRHEILGILEEEVMEFLHEVHSGQPKGLQEELIDVAVSAIWGLASIQSGKVDW